MSLKGKRIFITGGSRGIGLAIALKAARDGAQIAIAAKTTEPHPKLPGTIHTAAQEIENAGGQALPIQCDLRDEEQIVAAVETSAKAFGGIDIVINNASAINLTNTESTPAKRFDLMFDANVRGTFLTSQAAIPHLRASGKEGRNPHILTLSPPLSMKAHWFKNHLAYTMAKYGMSMCVLGMSAEFKRDGIAVNALWPRTAIDTAALQMIPGVDTSLCRKPEILADAAYIVLNRSSNECTGNFFVDDEVLASEGITDLDPYAVVPGTKEFLPDFFLD
ncbi:MAG: SDR family oxidoreductase [Candidatus Nanopelagicaceae bacterium]